MTQGFTRIVVGALLLAGGLPALAQSKMVTLAEVAQGEAGASIWVSGTVASRQQAALSAEVSGRVEWIAEFGSRVKAGTSCCAWTARPCVSRWSRRGRNKPERGAICVTLAPSSSAWIVCTSKECLPEPV